METIKELIDKLSGILENQTRTRVTENMPCMPMAILYAGQNNQTAQEDIDKVFHRVWRGRAEDICHFQLAGEQFLSCDETKAVLSPFELEDKINLMFSKENSFRDMSGGLLLCLIQDTSGYSSMEEFTRDYTAPDRLAKGLASFSKLIKIVLLDEIHSGRAIAGDIKSYLENRLRDESCPCDPTIILSNRLKNGVFLTGSHVHENHILAGDLLILANNGNGGSFRPKYDAMFPRGTRWFLTASFSHVKKPTRQIGEILVNAVLEWLGNHFGTGDILDSNTISQRLGISGGKVAFMEEFFQNHILERLPQPVMLEYLPRNTEATGIIGNLPFLQYNTATMGAFEIFYHEAVKPVCTSEPVGRDFHEAFQIMVQNAFSPREAARSLTTAHIDAVLTQVRLDQPKESLPTARYVQEKARADFMECCVKEYRKILQETGEAAKSYINYIDRLIEEFQHNNMLNVDKTLKDYYHPFMLEALNGKDGSSLLDSFNRIGVTKEKMMDEIYRTIEGVITNASIFSLPLGQEMIQRMGKNGAQIQAVVKDELTDGLSGGIRLQTIFTPDIAFETILVNQQEPGGTEDSFFQSLNSLFPHAECLDTGDSNTIEFVQLYTCKTIL